MESISKYISSYYVGVVEEGGSLFLSVPSFCACMLSHSVVSDPASSRTTAYQSPLSMDLLGQGYWRR